MNRLGVRSGLVAALASVMLFAVAATAQAEPLSLTVDGLQGSKANLRQQLKVQGQVDPATAGVPVNVTVAVGVEKPEVHQLTTGGDGKFTLPIPVVSCCTYKVTADANGSSKTVSFGVIIPKLHPGSTGANVQLFHSKLREQGYFVRGKKRFTASTGLAILAFRKVNKMHRSEKYSGKIFRILLQGRGAFPLQHPEEGDNGKHVEADLSRQVLVLAEGGVPKYTFPVSSGAGGTPTVTGKFNFYLKTPGYNAKRMYYSSYFIGGYATHGYNPVPNYPASHGCIRNPIPDSIFIYNWINIGDPIWVYH